MNTLETRFGLTQQTIFDKETGRVWTRDFSRAGVLTMDKARSYGARNGLRIPTQTDWQSLSEFRGYLLRPQLKEIGFREIPNATWLGETDYNMLFLASSLIGKYDETSKTYVVFVK